MPSSQVVVAVVAVVVVAIVAVVAVVVVVVVVVAADIDVRKAVRICSHFAIIISNWS